MDKININNLRGKCLAAMPSLEGQFARSLIFVCSHSSEGAMGFVVNKPFPNMSFSELTFNLPFVSKSGEIIPLYQGGPMERDKGFVLHDDSLIYDDTFLAGEGVCITSSPQILQDISTQRGPKRCMIVLGYAGWTSGQLEAEIAQNMWMVTSLPPQWLFADEAADKWAYALASLGVEKASLSLPLGHS
ncbi:MAG: YqgE/AlgH family protein [Alphaproteobacteria bacterium]|nr:YqgE/AlgH family protein [Alphaproteobacteria bacterium]MBQ9235674.1 YqgE/AlgH family protein [Alphaproteobacteria bacterium]